MPVINPDPESCFNPFDNLLDGIKISRLSSGPQALIMNSGIRGSVRVDGPFQRHCFGWSSKMGKRNSVEKVANFWRQVWQSRNPDAVDDLVAEDFAITSG